MVLFESFCLRLIERQELTENCETYMVPLTLCFIKYRQQNESASEEMQTIACARKQSRVVFLFPKLLRIDQCFVLMSECFAVVTAFDIKTASDSLPIFLLQLTVLLNLVYR